MKKHLCKELVVAKNDNEGFNNSSKWGFVLTFRLKAKLKWKIIVISLENIEFLHIEIVISMLNQIIKFLSDFIT